MAFISPRYHWVNSKYSLRAQVQDLKRYNLNFLNRWICLEHQSSHCYVINWHSASILSKYVHMKASYWCDQALMRQHLMLRHMALRRVSFLWPWWSWMRCKFIWWWKITSTHFPSCLLKLWRKPPQYVLIIFFLFQITEEEFDDEFDLDLETNDSPSKPKKSKAHWPKLCY